MNYLKNIRNKISKLIQNNRFLAAISVVIAFGLWCFVALTVNTEGYSIIRGVPIEYTNNANYNDLSVVSKTAESIDIVVYGRRSIVGMLSADDFSVTADYSTITEAGSHTLNLTVESVTPTTEYKISSYSRKTVDVYLDRMISRKIQITTELVGAKKDDTFYYPEPTLSKTEVTLRGGEGELNAIASCVAVVQVNGELNETKNFTAELECRNADGAALQLKNVTMNLSEVEVTIPVLKIKDVKVSFEVINKPAGFNFDALSYRLSQETILIAGPASTIDNLTEIDIGYVDLKELTLDRAVDIPVTLPAGLVNIENTETITVDFNFSSFGKRTMSTQTINVSGASSKYNITVVTKRITGITVVGEKSVIEELSSANIVAQIDISALGELSVGTQPVPVDIVVVSSSPVWAVGHNYTAIISVTEK